MPTPEQWRAYLLERLDYQAADIRIFSDYYDGIHTRSFQLVSAKYREAFGEMVRTLISNWCQIIVDAPVERLEITGFRFSGDQQADDSAWAIWKANQMQSQSIMAHTEAVKTGQAYVMVSPSKDGPPKITIEHPAQVIVEYAPGSRTQRIAALKRWQDHTNGHIYTTLYLPDSIHKWITKHPSVLPPVPKDRARFTYNLPSGGENEWVPRPGSGPNPLGEVPIWEIPNRPDMLTGGRSDLGGGILQLQDAINVAVGSMIVASEFAAYPQRVVTGLEVQTDEEGKPIPDAQARAAISRFWAFEDPEVRVQEFKAVDLGNYRTEIETLREDLAAQTRTPPHYMLGKIVNASGDALKSAEAGLVSRVKRKHVDFSDAWSNAMSAAMRLSGARANENIEVIWRDPEQRSEGELVDAAVKLATIGVPFEALWERIGATPQQVERWSAQFRNALPQNPAMGNNNNEAQSQE